ncbi:MAG: MogA/MoaB family molybdenum cofactor biosynthesis protein [Bacillota bacterium]|nr:MogA/MoaB family molybdenum cofactor biosynthesis protein [Bacillota bacterium]
MTKEKNGYKAGVLTVSDRSFAGQREDLGGPLLKELLEDLGFEVVDMAIVPDEKDQIVEALKIMTESGDLALVATTGGTGFSPRDITPEATIEVCDRLAPGLAEMMRAYSAKITNRACLSRAQAGLRGSSLIINFPGSPKAIKENLQAIAHSLEHGLDMLRGGQADCAKENK